MKKYEILDHTADIAIRIYGKTPTSLFKNSAICLFNLLIEKKSYLKATQRKINLKAVTYEDLLAAWLNELIFLFFTYKFLPKQYNVIIVDGVTKSLKVLAKGNILGDVRVKNEIKAVTYHDLKIDKTSTGFIVEIILDV